MDTLTIDNRKTKYLDPINRIVIFAYSVLFILTQSVVYRNYSNLMIKTEYILGLALTALTIIRFIDLSKEGKLDWIRLRTVTILYFVVRFATLALWGFAASIRKTGFFEGIYLLALSELVVDLKFVKKYILPTLLLTNLSFNILNMAAQLFFGVEDGSPVRNLVIFKAIRRSLYKYPNLFYKNVNTMGALTAFCILIALALIIDRGKLSTKGKILAGAYFVFQGYCMYYSESRAAILSFLLCLIILVVNGKLKIDGKKVLIGVFAAMLATIVFVIGFISLHSSTGLNFYEGDIPHNEMTTLEKRIDKISSSRYSIWKNSYYVMLDPKIALLGSGSIEIEHENRDEYKKEAYLATTGDTGTFSPNTYAHDHNGYIEMITCTGLLGAIFFAITIKKRIDHSVIIDEGIWYIIFCYAAFINQFEVISIIHKRTISYILILLLSVSMYKKRSENNE